VEMTPTRVATLALSAVVACFFVYLIYASKPASWVEADTCTVVGSRAVPRRDEKGRTYYAGEYRVQYLVHDQPYYAWVSASIFDPDQERAAQKASALPAGCPARIRYNPVKPDDNVVFPVRH
jgi:Protein of unknown function (DUF3592)